MSYLAGAVIGFLAGAVIAFVKDKVLWGSFVAGDQENMSTTGVYARTGISFAVNAITLLVIFLLRGRFPFGPWAAAMIGAATALGLINLLLSGKRVRRS